MSASSALSVRPAGPDDLDAIGAVHSRSWRAAYAAHLPAVVLDQLEPAALAEAWRPAVLQPPTPRHRVLVACEGADVAGFVAADDTGELVALCVDPSHQRQGHASRLLAAVTDLAREDGIGEVSAWSPQFDQPRRALLESAGLRGDGATRDLELPDGSTLRELHLVATLEPT